MTPENIELTLKINRSKHSIIQSFKHAINQSVLHAVKQIIYIETNAVKHIINIENQS